MRIWNRPLVSDTRNVLEGYSICRRIRRKYGKDTFLFLIRGKANEHFLFLRFLPEFLSEHGIKKYVFIGDCKEFQKMRKLYPNILGKCVNLSGREINAVQSAYCFLGGNYLRMSLSLMWAIDLRYNRCRLRLTDCYSYIDSYKMLVFDFGVSEPKPQKASFPPLSDKTRKVLIEKGAKQGKTVIVAPITHQVRQLPMLFWTILGKELERRGYTVLFMSNEEDFFNKYGFINVFFDYMQSIAVLEYAGHFIGARSGFCDIVSSADCNKVILYPTRKNKLDSRIHRTDISYYSLQDMGLTSYAVELVCPFARNTTDIEPETEEFSLRIAEDKLFFDKVLKCFPPII